MQEGKNLTEIKIEDQKIMENKELSIKEALIPVVFLMALLAYNIFFADGAWLGDYSNQFILLIGGFAAAVMGFLNKVPLKRMMHEVVENWKQSNALWGYWWHHTRFRCYFREIDLP